MNSSTSGWLVLTRNFVAGSHPQNDKFVAQQLVDLDRFEMVVKLLENGRNQAPFRARSLAPLENRVGHKEKLIALSRERFATRREIVDEKMRRWMAAISGRLQDKDLRC